MNQSSLRIIPLILAFLASLGNCLHASVYVESDRVFTFSTPFDYGEEKYNDVVVEGTSGLAYLLGSSNGPVDGNYESKQWRALVHKVAPDGTLLQEKVFSLVGQGTSGVRILDLDSGSLLVILEEGTGNTVWTNYRLWRISKDTLEPLWTEGIKLVFNSPGAPAGSSYQPYFATSGDGRYVICERVTGYEASSSNSRIKCFDADGQLLWQDTLSFQYASTGYTSPRVRDTHLSHALTFAPNGDLLIGGAVPNVNLPRVARYDANGQRLFEISLPNNSPSTIRTITCDDESNAYVLNTLGGQAAGEILLTRIDPSGGFSVSPLKWRRRNTDYFQYHSYSLAFVLGRVLVLEDTVSGIGAAQPFMHVVSKSLQLLHSIPFSFGTIRRSYDHSYSISSSGYFVAAGQTSDGRNDAVRSMRRIREDFIPPSIIVSNPVASTRAMRVRLSGRASDNVTPAWIQVRVKSPGRRTYGAWQTANLVGSNRTKSWTRSITLSRRGVWGVQVRAIDLAGNPSPVRTVSIRRR